MIKQLILILLCAYVMYGQGIVDPRLLRQAGATDGQVLTWSDANGRWGPATIIGGGSSAFSAITAGTNAQALVMGTGGSLTTSGSGTIVATTAAALASNPTDCSAGQYATTIAANGNLTCAQPAFSELSGSVTDAQVPNTITIDLATVATTANSGDSATAFFSTGTLEGARLPNPAVGTKGGVEALTCGSTDKISAIGTDGIPVCSADDGGGGGLANAYVNMTDGAITSAASGGDTFKFRSADNKLTVAVESNGVTHGDNLLLTINEANLTLSGIGGSVTDGQVPNTITIDLAAVATVANSGDSATAFFSSGTVEDARIVSEIARDSEIILGVGNLTTVSRVPRVSATGTLSEGSIFDDNTNVAIGTVDLDGTPAVGRLVVQGSTNNGTTNILVGRDSDGANVFTLDTNGLGTFSGVVRAADAAASGDVVTRGSTWTDTHCLKLSSGKLITAGAECGSGSGGEPNYESAFTAQTSITITGATHGFGHENLFVQCFDNSSPSALFTPSSVTIDTTSFDVVIGFSASTTGRCILQGNGGAGGGTVTNAAALTANMPVIGAGSNAVAVGTRSGNTTAFVTTTGTQTSGRCVEIDANGNHIAAAAGCSSGFDSTTIDDTTWSDGGSATITHTYAVTGTDPTFAATAGKFVITGDLEVSGTITTTGTAGPITLTEIASPSAPGTANQHKLYFDTDGLLKHIENGGSEIVFATISDTQTFTNKTLTSPTLTDAVVTGSLAVPQGTAPTTDAVGEIAFDTNVWGTNRGSLQIWDGTAITHAVNVLASDTCTNGQVPTWNTGGTWTCETPSGGSGGLVLLETETASDSATLDFACPSSTYDVFEFEFVNILPATDGTNFKLQVSTDGGSTFLTTDYGSAQGVTRAGDGSSTNGAASGHSSIDLSGFNIENTVTQGGLSGFINGYGLAGTASWKTFGGQTFFVDTSAFPLAMTVRGHFIGTSAVTDVRFKMESGNITSGVIYCYGKAK